MKTFEQHTNIESYYSVRWLNIVTSEFGEAEGRFETLDEILKYIGFDDDEFPHIDFLDKADEEFKIIKIDETHINKKELSMWTEAQKYNI